MPQTARDNKSMGFGSRKRVRGWLVKILGVIAFAALFSTGSPIEAQSAPEKLSEQRAYFAESGVKYGRYIFSVLDDMIVKIPLSDDKINANAQPVMKFPGTDPDRNLFFDGTNLLVNDGVLYINFSSYMRHGGLYRMTSDDAKPEFVVKTDEDVGGLSIKDSSLHPKEMKFLDFTEGDAGTWWGVKYCYFPKDNVAKKLVKYNSRTGLNNHPVTTGDDEIFTVRYKIKPGSGWERDGINGVDKLSIDVKTKKIKQTRLLNGKRTPKAYSYLFNEDDKKIYFLGTEFWVYDIKKNSLRAIVNFKEHIPDWPDNDDPYGDYSLYGDDAAPSAPVALYKEGIYCVSGDNRVIYIDVKKETYEVGDRFVFTDEWR